MNRAVNFYRDVLGLKVKDQQPQWSEIDADGLSIGLNARETAAKSTSGGAVISFRPDGELEAEVDRLRTAGVQFTGEISDHDWGRIVPFKDSEGNDLQLYSPPAS
jgi:predicted enzyme related to lactoylglutathione lyase